MIDLSWFIDNWPWWVAFLFLVVYELYALAAGKRTLSRMVWRSTESYPWMVPIAFTFLVVLIAHFWIPGAGGWVVAIVGSGIVWWIYLAKRKARS